MPAPPVSRIGVSIPKEVDVAGFASWAEDVGFDVISAGEHVYSNHFMHNALLALAAAAGITQRIRLLPSVLLFPSYPVPLLAKMVGYLDWLSNGRLEIGIGIGGEYREDFEGGPTTVDRRGAYVDAGLPAFLELLSGEVVSVATDLVSFRSMRVQPRSVQQPAPPLWIAGRSEHALARARRFDAGWLPYLMSSRAIRRRLDECDAGLRPGRVAALVFVAHVDDLAESLLALEQSFPRADRERLSRYVVPVAEDLVSALQPYYEAGADTVVVRSPFEGARALAALELLAGPSRLTHRPAVLRTAVKGSD